MLAFYQDVWDDNGDVIGWRTIAWGLATPDGSVVTIPLGQPTNVTLWLGLDDATDGLDAHVDTVDPKRPVNGLLPSRASATLPPRSSDDPAALAACPGGEARDRPLGAHVVSPVEPRPVEGAQS